MKKCIPSSCYSSLYYFSAALGSTCSNNKKLLSDGKPPWTRVSSNGYQFSRSIGFRVIEAIGFIEPNQGVTLANETSGVIDQISFESGTEVKSDQLLVRLGFRSQRKRTLRVLEARLPAAKAKYKRYQGLFKKGFHSKEAYDEAEANYFSLSADIESLKASIDRRGNSRTISMVPLVSAMFAFLAVIPTIRYWYCSSRRHHSVMRLRFTVSQTDISRNQCGSSSWYLRWTLTLKSHLSGSYQRTEPCSKRAKRSYSSSSRHSKQWWQASRSGYVRSRWSFPPKLENQSNSAPNKITFNSIRRQVHPNWRRRRSTRYLQHMLKSRWTHCWYRTHPWRCESGRYRCDFWPSTSK